MSPIGWKMIRSSVAGSPQYSSFRTSTSCSPTVHDSNLKGPVPVGCSVAYVPAGVKIPSSSTEPSSAPNSCRAAGLTIARLGSVSVERMVADGRFRFSVTVDSSTASQLLYRLSSGPATPSVGVAKPPPKPYCQ